VSAGGEDPARRAYRLRAYHLLAAVPAIGMLGGVPFANRVPGLVLGMPFLLLWILGWVIATSGCMALLYGLDRRRQPDSDGSPPR
jgi:hypothetical protein